MPNGHDAIAIVPTIELVLGNGHNAKGNGNGLHQKVDEPQRSLFSWVEFMDEQPVKPKERSRKRLPASVSLFEWALSLEEDHEEGLVEVGR